MHLLMNVCGAKLFESFLCRAYDVNYLPVEIFQYIFVTMEIKVLYFYLS